MLATGTLIAHFIRVEVEDIIINMVSEVICNYPWLHALCKIVLLD
jgi:hypothetical protein